MRGLELLDPLDHMGPVVLVGPAVVGPALKPRESSSAAARPVDDDDATQSAKAPESEGNLLVVATTVDAVFDNFKPNSQTLFFFLLIYIARNRKEGENCGLGTQSM